MAGKNVEISKALAKGFETVIKQAEDLRPEVVPEEAALLEALIAMLKVSEGVAMSTCPKQGWSRTFKVKSKSSLKKR
jgi:hypothetical protein